MQGSKPFSLGPEDWAKIGRGAILAVLGALATWGTAELMPTLAAHVNNELGNLIIALVAAGVPILLNVLRKWLGDTTPKLVIFGAISLVLFTGNPVMAWEFAGATAAAIDGTLLQNLFRDPLMLAAVLLGVALFASKVLKIDLSAFVIPLITSLLKPTAPGPVPSPTPGPAPGPAQPDTLLSLLQQLLSLLNKAEASGDEEGRKAVLLMLNRLSKQ